MQKTQNETDRAGRQYEALATHYRAIGPAAILAALVFARRPLVKKAA
jgi:uncharacterized protein (DUF433 family)